MIPIYKPYLSEKCKEYAHDAITSGWVSSLGPYKEKVEQRLKELLGVKYILLLNSGTAAVHLISRATSYFYKGVKNIIVPNNVYVAAWNGFMYDGKFKLIPVDADEKTWCVDLSNISRIEDNTALFIVHNVSGIVNVPNLKRRYGDILIFEDACEGFLGKYEGKYTGTQSAASSISFFGNKSITSGEGGALLTNNKYIYDYCFKLHGQGQSDVRYIHDEMGYNYRMTNIQAAILYGQLEDLPKIIEEKKRVFDLYRHLISDVPNVELQQTERGTEFSNWMVGVNMRTNKSYKKLEKYFKSKGIDIRPMFYTMSEHEHLKEVADVNNEKVAKKLSEQCFMVPSYPELKNEEVDEIAKTIKEYVKKYT